MSAGILIKDDEGSHEAALLINMVIKLFRTAFVNMEKAIIVNDLDNIYFSQIF
jgi:hypothetical protein